MELSVHLEIDLSSWNPQTYPHLDTTEYVLTLAEKKDLKRISDIARSSFTSDRFHLDFNIPKEYADQRFAQWIFNSYENKEQVYKFIDPAGRIIGFFITKDEKKFSNLRLAALDPRYLHKGLGRILYYKMFRLLKSQKIDKAIAQISCNNVSVLNVYSYLTHPKFMSPVAIFHTHI